MPKESEKFTIRLERHKWPDEIERERRRKRSIIASIFVVGLAFAIGWTFGSVFYTPSKATIQNQNIARFERVYNKLLNNWFFKNDMDSPEKNLIDNAINGMIKLNGDEHTSYMTLDESSDFIDSIDMNFVGIGVQYLSQERLITRVFKDSPAEKAGLLAGDVIVSVDQLQVDSLKEDEDIKEYILGEKGTVVKIGVDRQGEIKNFDVTRDSVNALTWGEIIDNKIGYLEIASFGSSLKQSAAVYLDYFVDEGIDHLIVDLRDNGGGYLEAIKDLASLFFKNGTTVYYEVFTDGTETEYKVKNSRSHAYPFNEIVILVNESSASASEVFAIAMRDQLNTKIIGTQTFGKGTVQTQVQDGVDNSFLKYTFAKWYSPKMENIHKIGINPDFEVRLPEIFYASYSDLDDKVVHFDEVHSGVAYIQKGLNFLGYHQGRMDGYYDQSTLDAILKYKQDYDFVLDDSINLDLIKTVYSTVLKEWSTHRDLYDIQLQKAIEVVQNVS